MGEERNLAVQVKTNIGQFHKYFSSPVELFERAIDYFHACHVNPLFISEQLKKIGKEILIPAGNGTDEVKVIPPEHIIEMPVTRAPTWQGLSLHCGTSSRYFFQFKSDLRTGKTNDPDGHWRNVIDIIQDLIFTINYEAAAAGKLNPMLTARYLGISEKVETKDTTNDKPKQVFMIDDQVIDFD